MRLYGWEPACISIGRNQKSEELQIRAPFEVVRRPTGGRALLHDNELTYSFICPVEFLENGEHISSSYKEISEALVIGLRTIGIELEFSCEKKVSPDDGYCMMVSSGADLA